MKLITLHLPEIYINALDDLVDKKFYPNRAEAIRTAVRDLLSLEAWGNHSLINNKMEIKKVDKI